MPSHFISNDHSLSSKWSVALPVVASIGLSVRVLLGERVVGAVALSAEGFLSGSMRWMSQFDSSLPEWLDAESLRDRPVWMRAYRRSPRVSLWSTAMTSLPSRHFSRV